MLGVEVATSSIGKTVRLNNRTGKKMVEIMAHPTKLKKPNGVIRSGRFQTNKHPKQ